LAIDTTIRLCNNAPIKAAKGAAEITAREGRERGKMKTTKIGTTAAEMTSDKAMQRTIRAQPGYRRGAMMRVARVEGSKAYRLYVLVGGQWMDASLHDMR
jgi:hypothetical protein